MVGERFGTLVVLQRVENYKKKQKQWLCVCDCGQEQVRTTCVLRRGNTPSCCYDRAAITKARALKHGLRQHYLYPTWLNMRQRCSNPRHPRYADWGGRGIRVCERWDDFSSFLSDVGDRPEGMTLDRIDNDGDYCPGNIRWATTQEQNMNKRTTKLGTMYS